jgi:hypothetical protein
MDRILLAGLMKIELRDTRVIRLCDGGFIDFGAERYRSSDATFGVFGALESYSEGVGEEVPAFRMTLLPPSSSAAADLSSPGMQGSRARFWTAEVDPDLGTVIGTPDLQFDGMIDQTVLSFGMRRLELDVTFVPRAERLFSRNEGNSLNPSFHKRVNPGELGEDNATGIGIGVAWGVEAQNGGAYAGAVGGGAGQVRFDRHYEQAR